MCRKRKYFQTNKTSFNFLKLVKKKKKKKTQIPFRGPPGYPDFQGGAPE